MKKFPLTIFGFLLCSSIFLMGQTNFRTGWEASNPIAKDSPMLLEEKVKTHQAFLEKAVGEGDTLKQLYGNLYLVYDHLLNQDYAKASEYLMEAQSIANVSGKPGWKGWVVHRQAIVASRLVKTEEALQKYLEAAKFCGEAKDSLCVAESLEQVSLMYGKLFDFENAERYHDIAMPLIEKYGGESQLGAALNNYGNINSWAGRYEPAVSNYERAIAIYRKLGKQLETAKAMNNLADAFKYLHRYEEAKKILQACMDINHKNNFLENLMTNYANLSVLNDSMGNYQEAFLHLHNYHTLRDSLIGAETQEKITELQFKYETQQKELELEKSKSALQIAQRKIERRGAAIFFGAMLGLVGLWIWHLQSRHAKNTLNREKGNLAELTRLLLEKNTQLVLLDEKLAVLSQTNPNITSTDFDKNLFAQKILTEADWASFKTFFEKAHPGYLQRLRNKFPALTDAEQRLFLFIKLNLTTKEAATILGISADSVKRTRNRLRKRLQLGEEVDLEQFIQGF